MKKLNLYIIIALLVTPIYLQSQDPLLNKSNDTTHLDVAAIILLDSSIVQSTDSIDLENAISSNLTTTKHEVKFIAYDTPPSPLNAIKPIYPESAKESGKEGIVFLHVFIDENGDVGETVILKRYPLDEKGLMDKTGVLIDVPELDVAAAEAIKAVRWEPAKRRGEPVGVWLAIPIYFKLDDKTE